MKTSKKLILELKKLNNSLDRIGYKNRYLVYNANPFKFAWFNFIAGIFHSLGTLFGTFIIAGILVYILSRFEFFQQLTNWFQSLIGQ